MKRIPVLLLAAAAFLCCQGVASAQAMVENALGAGRAATSTAPMSGLGKSVGGIAGGLEKNLNKAAGATETRTITRTVTSAAVTAPPPGPAVHYDDPRQIESGILYDELVRRFGPATLEITTSPVAKTLSYVNRTGAIQVEVREGKVISAAAPR